MNFVGEAPPSMRTIVGVVIVLVGCFIVLLRANQTSKEPLQEEDGEESSRFRLAERKKRANSILYSQMFVAPSITAKAASWHMRAKEIHSRGSMPSNVLRSLQLDDDERDELDDYACKKTMLVKSLTMPTNPFRRLSNLVMKDYGTMGSFILDHVDEEE